MFTSIDHFKRNWQAESGFTRKVLGALTDASLAQAVVDGHRTLGRVAWHITQTIPEMMQRAGLDFGAVDSEAPAPKTAADMAATYDRFASRLLEQVTSRWQDADLQVEVNFYGEEWKKGQALMILVAHEVHHRGQMTVLMRQAGLVVPSVYGPAKEGWAEYGKQPPTV